MNDEGQVVIAHSSYVPHRELALPLIAEAQAELVPHGGASRSKLSIDQRAGAFKALELRITRCYLEHHPLEEVLGSGGSRVVGLEGSGR